MTQQLGSWVCIQNKSKHVHIATCSYRPIRDRQLGEQTQRPPASEWINTPRCSHTWITTQTGRRELSIWANTRMNLRNIPLRERSQAERSTGLTFTQNLRAGTTTLGWQRADQPLPGARAVLGQTMQTSCALTVVPGTHHVGLSKFMGLYTQKGRTCCITLDPSKVDIKKQSKPQFPRGLDPKPWGRIHLALVPPVPTSTWRVTSNRSLSLLVRQTPHLQNRNNECHLRGSL